MKKMKTGTFQTGRQHVLRICILAAVLLCGLFFGAVYSLASEGEMVEPTPEPLANNPVVTDQDDINGILTAALLNSVLPENTVSVMAPVWTSKNGQDDLIWYDALSVNGDWQTVIYASEHGYESGTYNIHWYARLEDGSMVFLGGASHRWEFDLQPYMTVDENGVTVQITLYNAIGTQPDSVIYMPVWGNADGQNDLRWYQAEWLAPGTWQISVSLADHGETGRYFVHAYRSDADTQFITGTSFDVDGTISGTITVTDNDPEAGTFTLMISDVQAPGGVQALSVPVWTTANGQDDLVWHEAVQMGRDWFVEVDSAEHGKEQGKYAAHVYVTPGIGKTAYIGGENVQVQRDDELHLTAKPNMTQSRITIELHNYEMQQTVSNVQFAVWCTKDGQNDLHWYEGVRTSGGTWRAEVLITDHMEVGNYQIHAYESGTAVTFIDHTACRIEGITGGTITLDLDRSDAAHLAMKLTGVSAPSGIIKTKVAVWSQNNNQDDLQWYEGTAASDGWVFDLPLKNHSDLTGVYYVHAYAYDGIGFSSNVCRFSFDRSELGIITTGGINTIITDAQGGKFRVVIGDVAYSGKVNGLRFAVWTTADGQDDLVWYSAEQYGDAWYVDVDTGKDFNSHRGKYAVHIFLVNGSGKSTKIGETTLMVKYALNEGVPGIDVSQWQGEIDWDKVADAGVEFAMIRTGYGNPTDDPKDTGKEDPMYAENIRSAKEAGLKVGIYHYSYAPDAETAKKEAQFCVEIIQKAGVSPDYPVAFDIEEPSRADQKLVKDNTEMVKAFCDTITASGYQAIVYCNPNFIENYLDYPTLQKYGLWLASWKNLEKGYGSYKPVYIWQYGNNGSVDGIKGPVDINVSYLD